MDLPLSIDDLLCSNSILLLLLSDIAKPGALLVAADYSCFEWIRCKEPILWEDGRNVEGGARICTTNEIYTNRLFCYWWSSCLYTMTQPPPPLLQEHQSIQQLCSTAECISIGFLASSSLQSKGFETKCLLPVVTLQHGMCT